MKMEAQEIHKIEMNLVSLLEENKLTKDYIINSFTPLINEVREWNVNNAEQLTGEVTTETDFVENAVKHWRNNHMRRLERVGE